MNNSLLRKAVVFLALFFAINSVYSAEFGVLEHDAQTQLDSSTLWVETNASTPFSLRFDNDVASMNNITQINFWTTGNGIALTGVACPAGWDHTGFTTKSIECKSNTSVLQPGESAYLNATVVSDYVTTNRITVWNWFTTDDNLSYTDNGNVSISIDVTGPDINFITPTNNQYYLPGVIDINATATDAEVEVDNASAKLTVNCTTSNLVLALDGCSGDLSSCNFTEQWDSSVNTTVNAPFEACLITASVEDSFGNIGNDSIIINLDEFGPTIELIWPPNNSEIKPGDIINFSVSDPAGVDEFWYSTDGGAANITVAPPYDVDTTGWAAGSVSLLVWANDSLGNAEDRIDGFNGSNRLTVVMDDVEPAVAINQPISGWFGDSIFVNVTATDNNTVGTVHASINGTSTLLSNAGGSYWTGTVDSSGIAEGNHTLTINATDLAGNYNDSETVVDVGVEHVAPAVAITNPSDGADITRGNTVTFIANVSDTISGIAGDCDVVLGGISLGTISYDNNTGECRGDLKIASTFSKGSQNLVISVDDAAGNTGSDTISLNIESSGGGSSGGGSGPGPQVFTQSDGMDMENNVPNLTAPKINDADPFVGDTLTCLPGKYFDEDGDTKVADKWRWFVNGKKIYGAVENTLEIDNSFSGGDMITCSQSATDGMHYTRWVESSNSAVVQVEEDEKTIERTEPFKGSTEEPEIPKPSPLIGAFLGGAFEDDLLTTLALVSFFGAVGAISVLHLYNRNKRLRVKVK